MKINKIPRVFKFNDKIIDDPNPSLSPDEVISFLSNEYPEMTTSKIEAKGISNDQDVYLITTKLGTKG